MSVTTEPECQHWSFQLTNRQNIIDRIRTLLSQIKVTNGYETDIGINVFEWRENPVETSKLPAVYIRDKSVQYNENFGTLDCVMALELEVFCTGSTSHSYLRKALKDISGVMTEDNIPGVFRVYIIDDSMDVEQQENIIGSMNISYGIQYNE